MTAVKDSVALVTGANRGLGAAIVASLLDHGAGKVYAAARNPDQVTNPAAVPVALDVTDSESVDDVAARCSDTTILINNAGVARPGPLVTLKGATDEILTNYLGTLRVSLALAPVLAANGGGAIAAVLSVASFVSRPPLVTYSASKAAEWQLMNGLRQQLKSQHTQVTGVHVGFIDTELAAEFADAPKHSARDVADAIVEAIDTGRDELLFDDFTRAVKRALAEDLSVLYPD